MHVTHLTTNWKQRDNAPLDLHLGPRVLLMGGNGSGKSSVYEAIELALTGQVSNFAGRSAVKDAKRLWRAKPKSAKALWISLKLSTGSEVSWRQSRANGKPEWKLDGVAIKAPPLHVAAHVAALREGLFGSAQRAEKFLTQALSLGLPALREALEGTDAWDAVKSLWGTQGASPSSLLDQLKRMQREAQAEAKAAEEIEKELEHHAGLPPTDEEITRVRAELDSARAEHSEAQRMVEHASELVGIMDRWKRLDAELETLPLPDANAGALFPLLRHSIEALKLIRGVLPGSTGCPCCGELMEEERRTSRLRKLEGALTATRAAVTGSDDRAARVSQQEALKPRARWLADALPPQMRALVMAGDADLDEKRQMVAALTQRVLSYTEKLESMQARRVSAAAPQMAASRAEAAASRAVLLKEVTSAVEAAQATIVEDALSGLVSKAEAYFPARFGKARITLRPSVEIGVDRAGSVGAPSGAEEATLLLALAAALTDTQGSGDSFPLLIAEDRAFDSSALTGLLESFYGWDAGQIFIQAVGPWSNSTPAVLLDPDNWTICTFRGDPSREESPPALDKFRSLLKREEPSNAAP